MLLCELRAKVLKFHLELPRNHLVAWTSGNISAKDPDSDLVVIKPSGVRYEDLTIENLVIVNLQGRVIEGDMFPSVDTKSHLYIYRHRPKICSVVHTHSPYATAFAALGKEIPVVLTAIADEFGGPIPCGEYVSIGDEGIGREVLRSIGQSPAVLLKHHGVFTIGHTIQDAVKAAVMTEDVAKTVYFAMTMGHPQSIPQEEIERAHRRYCEKYGQQPAISTADFSCL